MNEQESNVCDVCGGMKRIEYVSELGNSRTYRVVVAANALIDGKWHLCWGCPEQHPPHKYCPKCELWRDMDGICCAACGTTLVLRRLDEPAPKHDGKLDETNECSASYGHVWSGIGKTGKNLFIKGVHLDGMDDSVHLWPKQALSLLTWLKQEEPTLQRLAKEQGE